MPFKTLWYKLDSVVITVLNELLSVNGNFESTVTIHVKSSLLMLNILVIMTHRRVINTAGGQRFTCSLVQGDLIGTSQSDFLLLEPRTKVKKSTINGKDWNEL